MAWRITLLIIGSSGFRTDGLYIKIAIPMLLKAKTMIHVNAGFFTFNTILLRTEIYRNNSSATYRKMFTLILNKYNYFTIDGARFVSTIFKVYFPSPAQIEIKKKIYYSFVHRLCTCVHENGPRYLKIL